MVRCGIDNILDDDLLLKNKRLALVTNPTGVTKELKSTIDVLNEQYDLSLLFSPEHGVRGDKQAGDHVATYIDEKTGIEVFSLYGQSHHIPDELTNRFDILVYDIQDTGSRYYTYISTLYHCMQSCAKHQKPFVILDRPNPIGDVVEGNILESSVKSFVGCFEMPQRYGLTPGEFALMVNDRESIGCEVHVVKLSGYTRDMYYDETGLVFINPSPNIPTVETEVLYNGTCLFEGTCISEGRGTTKPFEIVGAPWLDAEVLAHVMNDKQLPGVVFRPTFFTPTFSKHAGILCKGVQIHLTNKSDVQAVKTGLLLLDEVKKMTTDREFFISPPFETDDLFIDKLMGTKTLRKGTLTIDELINRCESDALTFKKDKASYHLYN